MTQQRLTAADVIRLLDLKPHPEGGHFRETFRDARTVEDGRAASTAIYFLLARGERSHWHRIDAAEVWHFYAGAPLELEIAEQGRASASRSAAILPPANARRPSCRLMPGRRRNRSATGRSVGCTVAPGFEFVQFELAPKGWEPG